MEELLSFARFVRALIGFARHVLLALVLVLVVLALVIAYAEDLSIVDAFYFTLITGLTVGYGDIVPVTVVGRIASVSAALTGLILTGLYIAIATKALSLAVEKHALTGGRGARKDGLSPRSRRALFAARTGQERRFSNGSRRSDS